MAGKKQPPRLDPTCTVCLVALSGENWTPSCQKARRYICSQCWVERQKRYAKSDPEHQQKKRERAIARQAAWSPERAALEARKVKNRTYLKKYGITLDKYEEMLENQQHRCAVCNTDEPTGRGGFHVDHCHSEGHVRGLLCSQCNMMLGLVGDNTEVLQNAIIYLGGLN